jgi:hypothetical protein
MSAEPKACAGAVREERLWELFKLAFSTLINRHICLPSQFYDAHGDREWESAQDLARHAKTLALAAEHEWNERDRPTQS